jgi:hypothetical protein
MKIPSQLARDENKTKTRYIESSAKWIGNNEVNGVQAYSTKSE